MADFDSGFHRLRVTDNDGVRLLKFERNQQSSMHIDDPFATDMEYVGYLHITVAVVPEPKRALVIGLGGGTVVKQLWRDHPELSIETVELDPEVIEVAHALFAVPSERIEIICGDGREALNLLPHTYDIVIVDAFDDDHVPRHLTTEEFMREARSSMTEEGAIAWNVFGAVYGPRSKTFRSMYRTARNVWRNVWVFPVRQSVNPSDETRNIVMVASDANLTPDQLLERIATRALGRVSSPGFERLGEEFYTGAVRSGDVPLLLDHAKGKRSSRR